MGTNMAGDSTQDKDADPRRCEEAEGTDVVGAAVLLEISPGAFRADVTVLLEYGVKRFRSLPAYVGKEGRINIRFDIHYPRSEDPGPEAGDTEQGGGRRTWEVRSRDKATIWPGPPGTKCIHLQGPGRLTYEQFSVEEGADEEG